jgi:large repetitive protein
MKIGKVAVAATLVSTALTVGGVATVASAAVATTTTVTAKNPLGNTPGKVVITGKIRPTTGTGTPTGTCTFVVDKTAIGTKPVNSRGGCSLTTHLKLGTHTIVVRYGGSATFAASRGSTTIDVTR